MTTTQEPSPETMTTHSTTSGRLSRRLRLVTLGALDRLGGVLEVARCRVADSPARAPRAGPPARGAAERTQPQPDYIIETRPMLIAWDIEARRQAATVRPEISRSLEVYAGRTPSTGATAAVAKERGDGYALTVAVQVGLNHWLPGHTPLATVFVPARPGADVELVAVEVQISDLARITSIATTLGVPRDLVLSCALCSGLRVLTGSRELAGPFEVN